MSYSIAVPIESSNGPVVGASVDAWAVSRFTSSDLPDVNAAPPSGSADAGPVTTGLNGIAVLVLPDAVEYFVRAVIDGSSYWTLTSEALSGVGVTALSAVAT